MESKIRMRHSTFSYGEKEIFHDLDLDLNEGDIFCLLGPNGCGKTTLLRCISGLFKLNAGSVLLDGRDVATMSETERARSLAFVFQEHNVHFPYTVSEIVQMGRTPHLDFLAMPSRRDVEVADSALERVGISRLRDQRYTEISGGERQLVLIARALAQETSVLVLDEPTSHLDFGNQMLILETIKRLAVEKNLTIAMATHFPDHALLASSKAALMKEGQFMAVGSPAEVITEETMKELYGVRVKVISVDDGLSGRVTAVVPLLGGRPA